MKRYFDIFKNWRIDALALMFTIGVALFVCDGNNIILLVVIKAVGLALIYLCGILVHQWKDKIKELDVFSIKEDEEQ